MCRITMTKWFEQCMLAAVIISSLLLAVDTPALDVDAFTNVSNTWVFVPDHWYRLVLDIVDFFFTAVFSIELIFRIIALVSDIQILLDSLELTGDRVLWHIKALIGGILGVFLIH